MVITQFDCNLNDVVGTAGTIDVYTSNGTYAGNENNQALWTLAGSAPCTAAGRDAPSAAVFNAPIVLNPGTYGIAICASGLSHAYTNGTGTNQTFSDPFFTANLGTALNVCFGTGAPFTPRVWKTFGLLCTFNTGGTGLSAANSGNFFDLNVTNPNGVLVTALDVMSWTAATGTVDDRMASAWTHRNGARQGHLGCSSRGSRGVACQPSSAHG